VSAALERAAKLAFTAWGAYAKFTACEACGERAYCRRALRGHRFVCLHCFDQGER
jgi:formylmethanofuran dehydrogenase subunit E